MKEDEPEDRVIDAHAEMVARLEEGSGKMRLLSAATILIAVVLSLAYGYQLIQPALGVTEVTVDLTSPVNRAVESGLLFLAVVWLYVGVRDYMFSAKLARRVASLRKEEVRIEKKIVG